jgi:hypothetical protein
MKKIILVFAFLLIISFQINAQAPDTAWSRTFGGIYWDEGLSVKETSDGGYIFTGIFDPDISVSNFDLLLVKTDYNGNNEFIKMYNWGFSDYGSSVDQTLDGGFIVTGQAEIPPSWPQLLLLIKTDIYGDTIWTKTYGAVGAPASGFSVQQTRDGGYIITGYQDWDAIAKLVLLKTDSLGNILWVKKFQHYPHRNIGYSVKQTSDDGYIITGKTTFFDGLNYYDHLWLLKTNSIGDTIWTKVYGNSYSISGEGRYVQETSDSGFFVVGSLSPYSNYSNVLLLKTDKFGTTLWSKTIVGNSSNEMGYSGQQTSDGGYIVTGTTTNNQNNDKDILVIKTNNSGDQIWTKTIGGYESEGAYSIKQTSDDGYILVGSTESFGVGGSDIWLIKLEPDVLSVRQEYGSESYILGQNYPNPFNPSTKISWQSPVGGWQTLKVYDILGNEIATLVNEYKDAGSYEIDFKSTVGSHLLANGVYFYRLKVGNFVETKKMLLLK